jgi:hypothetical protein
MRSLYKTLILCSLLVGLVGGALADGAKSGARRISAAAVKAQFEDDVMKLAGVTMFGVTRRHVDGRGAGDVDVLVIGVKDEQTRSHVHELLRDDLYGYPIVFEIANPVARPAMCPASPTRTTACKTAE